jgi:site-specific DNA recombinase
MKKAAIYARFSTDKQTESSIADQVRICTEYAKKNGMKVVAKFEDQGISGAALGNRPGVLKMRDAALARQFDVLLLMDVSRLSRSMGDVAKLVERLVFKDVRVVGVQDGADTGRDGWEVHFGMAGIMGQHFRQMVAKKTFAALESRAKAEKPTGGKAYGYVPASKSKSGDIEIDDAEARTVREIFRLYVAGDSEREIAGRLNQRGVLSPGSAWKRTTRRACGWMGSGIRAMLRNPIYIGEVIWNQSYWKKDPDTGIRKRYERPEQEWIRHVDENLRIVDGDTWDAAVQRIGSRKHIQAKGGGRSRYLLSGLLRCDACGAHYILANGNTYGCSGHLGGKACSNKTLIRRDVVETKIAGQVIADLRDPKFAAEMGAEIRRQLNAHNRAGKRQQPASRELLDLDARVAQYDLWAKKGHPDLTRDEIATMRRRAVEKRAALVKLQPSPEVQSNKLAALVPKAVTLYLGKIQQVLDGKASPDQTTEARRMLFEIMGGPARLRPTNGGLYAHFAMHPAVVLRQGHRGDGSGGRI